MIRFTFYFLLSFLVLSFPVKRGTVFDILHDKTSRITDPIYNNISKLIGGVSNNTSGYAKKLFVQIPPPLKVNDNLNTTLSATQKEVDTKKQESNVVKRKQQASTDHYTEEEQELLKKIIKGGEISP